MDFIGTLNRLQKEQKPVRILTPGTSPLIGWVTGTIEAVYAGGTLSVGWHATVRQEDGGKVTRIHVPLTAIMRVEEVE